MPWYFALSEKQQSYSLYMLFQLDIFPDIWFHLRGTHGNRTTQPTLSKTLAQVTKRYVLRIGQEVPRTPTCRCSLRKHDDVIKWKYFPRCWPFARRMHWSPVNSPHKGQWCGALIFSLIWAWINSWVNKREASDLRRHHAHYDVSVMNQRKCSWNRNVL